MSVVRSAIRARLAGAVASTLIISGAVTARAAGFEWAKASDGHGGTIEIGGEPDLKRTLMLCREFPQAPDCGFIRDRKGDQLDPAPFEAPVWTHDPRIKAAVIAAPAASFTFGPGSLAKVSVPVQLWSAENDQMAPARWNSDLVARGLRAPLTEVHTVSRAGHFAFVTPDLCASAEPGFDCAAFHRSFNAAVVQFFRTHL